MAKVLRPLFGKPCTDCGDQIDPRRVRLMPLTKRCTDCQYEWDTRLKLTLQGARDNDVVIIRH